jgi:predicted TIM-barrel fold metal-dependent hydrolase
LKIAFAESQVGWMPYVMERIDRIWRMGNAWRKMDAAIVEPPSTYMAGRVYGCFFEDDFGIFARENIGIDQITFETDYPHVDSMWPNTLDYLNRAVAGLPDDDVVKIARTNALRMLDLPAKLPA